MPPLWCLKTGSMPKVKFPPEKLTSEKNVSPISETSVVSFPFSIGDLDLFSPQ